MPQPNAINIQFTEDEKRQIEQKCGLVPVRRQLRQVILEWLHEPEEGGRIAALCLHVDGFIMIFRIKDQGQV